MESRRSLARLGRVILAGLVLSACASGAATTHRIVPTDGDFTGLIPIGGGRTMHLECSGTGSPTVLLIPGTGNAGDVWREARSANDPAHAITVNNDAVFPTTARSTRVCAYDRPGTRRSDGSPSDSSTVPQPTSAQSDAADIHECAEGNGRAGWQHPCRGDCR